MAVQLSEFRKLVSPFVRGCPDPILDYAILRSAREFSQDSWFDKQTIVLNMTDTVSSYQLVPVGELEVLGICHVQFNGSPISPTIMSVIKDTDEGDPSVWVFKPPDVLVVSPVPDRTLVSGFQVSVAVQPSSNASEISDSLFNRFSDEIAEGAKMWLYMMPRQEWSNPQFAVACEKIYGAGKADATRLAWASNSPANMIVRLRTFAV